MADIPSDPLSLDIEAHIARITLDRAARHNAFDDDLIARLTETLESVAGMPEVRAVILAAAGRSFCAGADLGWMQRTAGYTRAENTQDARRLARLMALLDGLPKPTIALVQGAAYGGGVGLVAACDIAIATATARFCLSEVRLGLIPAVISPYVVAAIGVRAARRYFLTAEPFDAAEAHRIGLVHEVVPEAELAAAGARMAEALLACGPQAVAGAKRLIAEVAVWPPDDAMIEHTAQRIADVRAGAEAGEGMAAFFDKRPPRWSD